MKSVLRFPFYAKASLICIGLVTFISALFILQDIILPIIYATIIAIVLSPFVNFLVRKKCNRILAISFILLIVFIITLSLVALLSSQVMQFSETLPKLIEKFNELIDQSKEWTSDYFNISTRKINLWLTSKNKELLSGSTGFIGDTLVQTGNVLIVLVLVPVYVFMFLFYQPFLIEFIHKLFKSSNQHDINKLLSATKKIIQSYLVGLLLEAGIIAVLNSSALLIIGIDYAILLGVIGAILNVIPYIGGIVAVALPMAIALATKSSSSYCLLVFAT